MLGRHKKDREKRPPRGKISDPVRDAEALGQGPFTCREELDRWGPWAARFTTTAHFGQVEGIRYFNNCGPTALTNLICMLRARAGAREELPQALDIYHQVARFGVRHLYFVNSNARLFHGTSDLRAASYIRRMCKRLLGWKPKVRLHRITETNVRRALEQGDLLYLMLWNHPAYRSHHLLCYGWERLRSETTGAEKTYLKVCDGHNSAPRFVDLADARGLFCQIGVPWEEKSE